MSEVRPESMMVISRRPRGRPRVAERGSAVMTWLKSRQHDFVVRLADERSTSVSAVIRDLVDIAQRVVEKKRGPH